MKMWAWILMLLAAVVLPAAAQTTQPAPGTWDQAVQAAAKAFSSQDECTAFLCDDCIVRSFDTTAAKQIEDVEAHASGATLLMARSYQFPDGTIASDIGAAVVDSQVPDDLKKLMSPGDTDSAAKANQTATRWVQNALGANAGDPVAVLVYFISDASQSKAADGQMLFVMLKGRQNAKGDYQVSQVVYGNSQQAAVTSAR
jgi:hypothetical protein